MKFKLQVVSNCFNILYKYWCQVFPKLQGARWLSGRVLDSRPKGRGFEPHRRHCVVSLSKNINPSLVLVQPRKIRPFITERLLMGRKESNQTNKFPKLFSYSKSQTVEDMFGLFFAFHPSLRMRH